MATFTGKIISVTSEAANGAPVVADIQTDTGIETVAFERDLWNTFVDDHAEAARLANEGKADFRVGVWGEPWQQGIRCQDPNCKHCNPQE